MNLKEEIAFSGRSIKELMGFSQEGNIGKKYNECPVCQMGFATNGSMMRHKRSVHDSIKKWNCDMCEKNYTSSQSLREHKVKHSESDNKLWKCKEPNCIKGYTDPHKLKYHKRQSHTKKQDMIQCGYCDKEFAIKQATRNHEAILHRFSCDQCKMAFIKVLELRSHILNQHKETEITMKHINRWDKALGIENSDDEDEALGTSISQMDSFVSHPNQEHLSIITLDTKPNQNFSKEGSVDENDTFLSERKRKKKQARDHSPPWEPVFVPEANKKGKFQCDQ